MTSVKIVTVDYYLSYPVKDLDVCYSEFRGTEVRQVPVLQIFGSTPEGTKTCLHIHGVLPYIYIPYDGVEPAARMSYQLAAEIDRTLNVSLGQASANTCFVHNILLVSGIPLYGYHEREHQYFKIFFYNPMIVKKACSLLENGVILGKHFQPHESHINYVLQFMIDYNLQGMNYIKLSRVMYRPDPENPSSLANIPLDQILPASVQRRSFSRLECDAMARDILNIEEVCSGQLAVNPGLAALWDDERQRRRNNELDSQISFCLTQDRARPKATATHRMFKQKLREKLANATSPGDVSGRSELEQSVYPAETPADADLLNASVVLSNETNASAAEPISRHMGGVVLSNALTTPSDEANASAAESTSSVTGGVVLSNETNASSVDMSVLHLLQDLKANADAQVLEDSVIESSQVEHDGQLLKLLQELREGANVEEDSILSQTVVQHTSDQPSSDDDDDDEQQSLSLPLNVKVNETGDDDSVWENSYWDENCEIPQVDGQCDSSSTTSSSSSTSGDEMDDNSAVTPVIAQAVQMAGKHYAVNMADFSVTDSEDCYEPDQESSERDRARTSTKLQYYQPADDNCCFPDTMTDSVTQCSVPESVKLRKANEVYLGQNHRGTLTNSQLLAPGINILQPITPQRIAARERNKIEITEVIINPGLNVCVSRLARDLCTVQIESKSPNDNNNKPVDSAAATVTNENKTSDSAAATLTNENKTSDSATAMVTNQNETSDSAAAMLTSGTYSWKTNFTNAMFTSAFKTISARPGNESEQSSKDTDPTAPDTGRQKRRRKYPSFTKSRNPPSKTPSIGYRFKKPEHSSADAYDLRPKRVEPHGDACFGCRAKQERTLADIYNGCVNKRKRRYRKAKGKTRNRGRKSEEAGVEDSASLANENRADAVQSINSEGQTHNLTADNVEEHTENGGGHLGNHTCEHIPMDQCDSSARNNTTAPSSSSTMRTKRKHAARCEYRMQRIQDLEVSDCSEQEEPTTPPVKRTRRVRRRRAIVAKKVAQLRMLQSKLKHLQRVAAQRYDGTAERKKLAMRFKRLQREQSDVSDTHSYVCEMVDGSCRNNDTENSVNRCSQNSVFSSSAKLPRKDTKNHNFSSLITSVVSIAGTAQTTANNMSSLPSKNARDDCITLEVTHSANCTNSSRTRPFAGPVNYASSSSSDTYKSIERIQREMYISEAGLSTPPSELNTDAADAGESSSVSPVEAPSSRKSSRKKRPQRTCSKICDNAAKGKTNGSNRRSKLQGSSQNELAVRISAVQQPDVEMKTEESGIVDKTCIRWNVDGANDTLSSSDSSVSEQPCSRVMRRRKSKVDKKTGETLNGSSDSDNTLGKLDVKSIQKQTRSKSTKLVARQQLKSTKFAAKQQLSSPKLLTKQLQVRLVPLEFLTKASKAKSSDKYALPTKQQLDKTALNSSHPVNTLYKSKPKPTRTSPRFNPLAVTIRSPKSKRHARQNAEPDLKRIKIANNWKKRQDFVDKDNTMESDRNVRSGELQMFGIVPIIQNSNPGKKLQSRPLNSNTTCDIVNQNNNSVPTSIISELGQCDKTQITVKKQLFSNKPPRKTIVVNINTDTNTTFVEEHKVCAYEKSARDSVVPKFVQIQRLKDLIAKEEEEEETFPPDSATGKMADDTTFNFPRPPDDLFEPTCDVSSAKHTGDLYSETNSAVNLQYLLENTLSQQLRDVTSTSSDAPIAFHDQPVRTTRLDTPYVNNDFSSADNNVQKTPENPRQRHGEKEAWVPVICYDDECELSTAQQYDLQCGFVPQPSTSAQVACFVRCARFCDNEYDREQAAIMQSLLEQHAKKQTEVANMQYDPDCDGEPMDCSLPFEPNKESVDSETLVSSTDDDSLMINNYGCSIREVETVTDMDQLESCSGSPTCDSTETSKLSTNFGQPDINTCDLLTESDKTEITINNSVEPPEVNHNMVDNQQEDDVIAETTPPKSSIQIFTLLHTTTIPSEIKTRLLVPKYHAPSRLDIMNSLAEYNIPECRHQEPFYSNPADVTGKMDVGHNVLKIPSNSIQDLEEFKSCTGFPGLDAWRREKFKELYPDVDVSTINFRIAFAGQQRVVMEPGGEPPSRREAEQWVEEKKQAKEVPVVLPKAKMIIPLSPTGDLDDSMSETMTLTPCTPLLEDTETTLKQNSASLRERKASDNLQRRALFSQTTNTSVAEKPVVNLSDTSVYNNSHQITGVNFNSKVELENLQHAKALSEPLNLTIMVVEVYVRTRGELYPDPLYDPVRAIFYSILNDMPAGSQLPREETGVLVVNTLDDSSSSNLLDGSGVSCEVVYVQSEQELVSTFVQLVRKWDPDICAGYELEMQSWGYLIERCNVLGVNLTSQLSRINPEVVKKRANSENEQKDLQITGRIILDVWRLMRHEVALQSYTFENIMYHILHQRVPKFSYQRLTFYWEYKRNFYRHITAKYYILRVKSVLQLLEQLDLIGRTSELAKLFGIQFFEVLSRGSQFRVESMMLRLAKPLNYIPVSPSVTQRAKMRAPEFLPLIFEPESRFYADPVIVLDFQSLYPSIIIAYNYCFSTCIGRVELLGSSQPFEFGACQLKVPRETLHNLEHKVNFSPCGVGFVKPEVRQGILPRMLKEILETRLMVKSSMKENRDNKLLQRVLHSRQLGLKLIANVTYGYTAANFSGRMPCIEVGDSVVSKGRETLERAIKLIEQTPKWRAKVVYGDTDSVFVMVAGRSKAEAFRIGAEIAEAVTNDNPAPVKLKLEKVFLPCILQTKKRYVGYMYESVDQQEPEYCAKGIETVRRDGCPAVAKMLENTLRTLFETRDVSLVKRYVCRQFSKLLSGRVSLQDLTFAREYRGASGYRPGACVPALVLARKWAVTDKRREPRRGERVPYVIVNGPPGLPLIRLVRCPRELLADPSRLRPNAVYYITRVIAPALNRCFTLIGADVLAWYNEMPRRQLQQLPTEDSANVKKSTISQYFATTSCAACGQQSRDGLCDACAKDPQQSVVVMYMKINNWERTYDEVSLICESCCGRKTDCSSLDCPVLYRLNQVRRDLRQVPYVRKQIAKFTDE